MVTQIPYIPDRGDIVWLDFNPQAGREQAGRRPALVLSPSSYNGKTSLALFCPITSQMKGYPFEVPIPADLSVNGVIDECHDIGYPDVSRHRLPLTPVFVS